MMSSGLQHERALFVHLLRVEDAGSEVEAQQHNEGGQGGLLADAVVPRTSNPNRAKRMQNGLGHPKWLITVIMLRP